MTATKERLRKIHALALNGSDGERQNAERLRDKMLKRYGLNTDDLLNEESVACYFPYDTKWQAQLVRQIIVSVVGAGSVTMRRAVNNKTGQEYVNALLTNPQGAEVWFLFEEYKQIYVDEEKVFLRAFFTKHDLLADCTDEKASSDADLEMDLRAQKMARMLKDSNLGPKRLKESLERTK